MRLPPIQPSWPDDRRIRISGSAAESPRTTLINRGMVSEPTKPPPQPSPLTRLPEP